MSMVATIRPEITARRTSPAQCQLTNVAADTHFPDAATPAMVVLCSKLNYGVGPTTTLCLGGDTLV